MQKFADFFKKNKNESAYTYLEAKDKKNRYVNFEMEQVQSVYKQLVESNFKKSKMSSEYRFARTTDNHMQRARTAEY